ncbi:MAG TPA: hypothetical protein VFU50_05410 [Terriglobales bacterium]|nr:hypothetical protein [Terriglobales bacterium]
MRSRLSSAYSLVFFVVCTLSTSLWAQTYSTPEVQIQNTGISGMWVLANISFAGMRAQNHQSILWRSLAFIFGLPGTIVSFFAVEEGSNRAYGINLPRR